MPTAEERLAILDEVMTEAASKGLLQLTPEDDVLDGRTVKLDGHARINFGSCSYLGLELDPRMRESVIDAVNRYGTQFSSSRGYMGSPQYLELESLLDEMFGGHVLVTPTTSLGHLATLPVIVESTDAVILDHQVHASVQMAANQLRVKGATVELIRHNNMERLEAMIERVAKTHSKLWYMADGVYSMFADLAPFAELSELLDRHEQLHLYIDDSHGVGWAGKHGRGPALDALGGHPRVVASCSLNKSFAAAGGAMVFPDAELYRKVRTDRRPDDLLRPDPAAAARRRDPVGQDPPLRRAAGDAGGAAGAHRALHRPRRRVHDPARLARRDADPLRPAGPAGSHARRDPERARRRLLHEHRHVPGRSDEARGRARDDDAAPHARRRPRAGRLARPPRPGGAGARWRGGQAPSREGRRHEQARADARAPSLGDRARRARVGLAARRARHLHRRRPAVPGARLRRARRAAGGRVGVSLLRRPQPPRARPCWPRSSRRRCGRTT